MKKLFSLLLAVALLATLTGCSNKPVLKVFNWGEYIDEEVLKDFEKEFNCKVSYDNFDSNEMMYTKLQDGTSYDVLIPSDYMIARLIEEGLIQKLDFSKIPNFKDVYGELLNKEFDLKNEYSVPYFWGNVGIVYDTTIPGLAEDVEAKGWEVLKNPAYKGQVIMYNSERDSFMVAEKALGYSMNSENEEEIRAAYNWLVELADAVEPLYLTDDAIDQLAGGGYIGYMYSGDAAWILEDNEDVAFFAPEEGTNIWVDSMVIPANAENVDLAHEFINFILRHEVAESISEEVGYASVNEKVLKDLAAEEFAGNDAYFPRTDNANDESYINLKSSIRDLQSDLWIDVIKH